MDKPRAPRDESARAENKAPKSGGRDHRTTFSRASSQRQSFLRVANDQLATQGSCGYAVCLPGHEAVGWLEVP